MLHPVMIIDGIEWIQIWLEGTDQSIDWDNDYSWDCLSWQGGVRLMISKSNYGITFCKSQAYLYKTEN